MYAIIYSKIISICSQFTLEYIQTFRPLRFPMYSSQMLQLKRIKFIDRNLSIEK